MVLLFLNPARNGVEKKIEYSSLLNTFMKNLYIVTEHDFVIIKDADDDDFNYPIRKQELPLTRDGNKSEWIVHLLLKTWVSTEILYKLALVIQREFPGNKISWKETFFVIEKVKYLDTLDDVLTEKSESITKSLMTRIDFGQKETREETHEIIDKIVNTRLAEFGL